LRKGIIGGALIGGAGGSVIPGLGTFWGGLGGAFIGGTGALIEHGWNSGQAGGDKTIQVSATLNVDGRKLAEAVTTHQVAAASGAVGAASGPDYTDRLVFPF
jgi:hypothetical protein